MASKTYAPIIPYAITGEYKIFSNDLKIIFGKPFYPKSELSFANEELYNKIACLLQQTMSEKELCKKVITPFKEWENEQKKTS